MAWCLELSRCLATVPWTVRDVKRTSFIKAHVDRVLNQRRGGNHFKSVAIRQPECIRRQGDILQVCDAQWKAGNTKECDAIQRELIYFDWDWFLISQRVAAMSLSIASTYWNSWFAPRLNPCPLVFSFCRRRYGYRACEIYLHQQTPMPHHVAFPNGSRYVGRGNTVRQAPDDDAWIERRRIPIHTESRHGVLITHQFNNLRLLEFASFLQIQASVPVLPSLSWSWKILLVLHPDESKWT